MYTAMLMKSSQRAPLVSVAMATYNGAEYLTEQLDSIASQTVLPDQLVIADDGSTDETCELVRRFAKDVPFDVDLVEATRHKGYVRNFERALTRCTGDIVFLSDQDDVWFREKIERVRQGFLDNPDVPLIVHDQRVVGPDLGQHYGSTIQTWRHHGRPLDQYVAGCATAVRRDVLEIALPFPSLEAMGHDGWLHTAASALGARHVLQEELMYYRRHGANTSISFVAVARSTRPLRRAATVVLKRLRHARSGKRTRSLEQRLVVDRTLLERVQHIAPDRRPAEHRDVVKRLAGRVSVQEAKLDALRVPMWRRLPSLRRCARLGCYAGPQGLMQLVLDATTRRR